MYEDGWMDLWRGIADVALVLGALGVGVCSGIMAMRWHVQRVTRRVAELAAQHARAQVVHEVRMLEHAHLKAGVMEALVQVRRAQGSTTLEQMRSWLHEAELSLVRLTRLVQELHRRGAAVDPQRDSAVTPVNLERTVVEVCKTLRTLGASITVERSGLPRGDVPAEVHAALELALYNAIINAHQHGRARRIAVQVTYDLDAIGLAISDDGVGFDPTRTGEGRGLRDIRDRVARVHGTVEVQSAPGRGTVVRVQVPLPRLRLGWASAETIPDRSRAA